MITVVETVDHSVSKLQSQPSTMGASSQQQQQQQLQDQLSEKDAELTTLRSALKSVGALAAQARAAVASSSTAATIGGR